MGLTKMTELVKYPMFKTYTEKGMSVDQIKSDATMTMIERGLALNDGERAALGIGTDFFQSENLLGLWDNKRIRFEYDQGSVGDPTYRISIDVDGDGQFMALLNKQDPTLSFKPERNRELNASLNLEDVRADYQNDAWNKWFDGNVNFGEDDDVMSGKRAKDEFRQNNPNPYYERYNIEPKEQAFVNSTMKGMFNMVLNAYNKGKNGVEDLGRMFNDIEWLPNVDIDFDTVERQLQKNQVDFIKYQKQKEAGVFEDTIADKFTGGELTPMETKDGETKYVYQQTATNLFRTTIGKQEGGFLAQVYDSAYKAQISIDKNYLNTTGTKGKDDKLLGGLHNTVSENSKLHQAEYDLMMSEDGDPTIGTGLSLKDGTVKMELKKLGYDIDKLLRGEQLLKVEDDQYIMNLMIDQKIKMIAEVTGIKDLETNKNAYLTVALVKLGYNSMTWIGPRFQEALSKFIETGDMKYIGDFGSYNKGEGDIVFSDKRENFSDIDKYEPALLNELWNDAEGEAEDGYAGFRTKFADVAGYLQAWSQGQQTFFSGLNPPISNLGESNLDNQ